MAIWAGLRALSFEGSSAGFAYGQGRFFGIRLGSINVIRVDLHPMRFGTSSRWHVHLFGKGESHGLRIPLWPKR